MNVILSLPSGNCVSLANLESVADRRNEITFYYTNEGSFSICNIKDMESFRYFMRENHGFPSVDGIRIIYLSEVN